MATINDPVLQQLLQQYQSSPNPESGIPIALLQYAQAHPEAMIDRSGQNLATTDPMFNFYNPGAGQTQDVNWFPMDDRNNPALNGTLGQQQQPGAVSPTTISSPSSAAPISTIQIGGPQTLQGGVQPQVPWLASWNQSGQSATGAPAPAATNAPAASPFNARFSPTGTPSNGLGGPTGLQNLPSVPQAGDNVGSNVDPNTGLIPMTDANGNIYGWSIPGYNVPAPPNVPGGVDPAQQQQYLNLMNAIASQIQQQYQYQTPLSQAAQQNLGAVPQPGVAQQQITPEIQRLLSGQGYDPATLAQMRAGAIDSTAAAGRSELNAGRIAAEQAGLQASPAGGAVSEDIARRAGIAQTSALRDVNLANAQQGMNNFLTGVGYQTQIGGNNMQQANEMALANANRLFAAMNQNVANQQQSGLFNAGNQNSQMMNQANQVSNVLGQQGNALNQGALNQSIFAGNQNAQNTINWQQLMAQLARQQSLANQGTFTGQQQNANSLLFGGTNNLPSSGQGPGTSTAGNAFSNIGGSILNQSINSLLNRNNPTGQPAQNKIGG